MAAQALAVVIWGPERFFSVAGNAKPATDYPDERFFQVDFSRTDPAGGTGPTVLVYILEIAGNPDMLLCELTVCTSI